MAAPTTVAGPAPGRPLGGGTTRLGRLRAWMEGRAFPYILIAPTLVTLVLIGLVPFLYTVYISLHATQFTRVQGFVGFDNFGSLLSSGEFWHSMVVTGVILVIGVPIQLLLGLGFALLFSRGVFGSRVLSPLFLIPAITAPTVVAIVWKIMLAPSWGFMTYEVVDRFGLLAGSSVLSNKTSALAAIIFIDVWQWTPFVTLALFAGLQGLPRSPYGAASVDGASRWQTLRYITLPGLYPLIAVLLLLRVIDTVKIFDVVFLLTSGGPDNATQTISMFLYKDVFEFFNVGEAAAAAVIIFVLFFILASAAYRLFTRRLKLF
jgi:multiple sugar transport system permease protein